MTHRSPNRRRGASTLEYALVMALIVGSAMVAIDLLGTTMKSAVGDRLAKLGQGAPESGDEPPEPVAAVAETAPPTAPVEDGVLGRLFSANTMLTIGLLALVAVAWRANRKREQVEAEVEEQVEERQARFVGKRQSILRVLNDDLRALLEDRLTVGNVMTRVVSTVLPNTSTDDLRELMEEKKMRHVLVCDAENRLLGVISDRDLFRKQGKCAADLMTPKPHTVSSQTPLRTAVSLILDRRISSLPVVDDERLTGIVTITDMVMTLQCSLLLVRNLFFEMSTDDHCLDVLARAAGRNAAATRSRGYRSELCETGPVSDVEDHCATGAMSFCEDPAEAI